MPRKRRVQTTRSPAWVQNIDRPEAWAQQHLWLLAAIFGLFDQNGDWPTIEAVQRVLADSDAVRAAAVPQLAIDIPNQLGGREADRFVLTTQALMYCEDASSLLSLLVSVIRLAAVAYRASDDDHPAVLAGFAVKQSLKLDSPTYTKLSRLLFREPWFFAGGAGDVDTKWQRNVVAEVLLAEHIESIDEYLDAVMRYRFGPPEIDVPPPDPFHDRAKGLRDWFAKRDVTIRDLLVITVLGGIVVGVLLWLLLG